MFEFIQLLFSYVTGKGDVFNKQMNTKYEFQYTFKYKIDSQLYYEMWDFKLIVCTFMKIIKLLL